MGGGHFDDLSRGHEQNVPKGARFVRADIARPRPELVATGKFDAVNHHAARSMFACPWITCLRCLDQRRRSRQPLEGAGEGSVKRFIFASSGGVVYGDPEAHSHARDRAQAAGEPYGVSKLSGEYYLRALGALRGFEGVAMRYANVFGPRQDPKSEAGVVSIFVSRLLEKRKLTVFGDGKQTRDYVFVKDVARANVLATTAALPATGDFDAPAFNIATSRQTSVIELAEAVGKVMKQKPELEFAPPRQGELFRSALDIGKAKRVLGWEPKWTFDDGLPLLVDWFQTEAR